MEPQPNSKGKILTIVFLLLILLPISYALFRARVLDKNKTTTTQPSTSTGQR